MKIYKTKEELLNHLKEDRHILLEESLLPIFDIYRYGQIIDAYKDILASNILGAQKIHIYDQSITLKSFINVMNIDEYISIKLIAYISHYEKVLKKFISDKVCESMVDNGSLDCCDYTCFSEIKKKPNKTILNCFIPLNNQYDKKSKLVFRDDNTFASRNRMFDKILDLSSGKQNNELNYYANEYYKTKHAIPFYVLVGSLSFTSLIILFEMLNMDLQIDFMRNIHGKIYIEVSDLSSTSSKHFAMRRIRNIIHHHEPLIPFVCRSEYLSFEVKKEAITLLKETYDKSCSTNKLNIRVDLNFDEIKALKSNSAKKLDILLSLIK